MMQRKGVSQIIGTLFMLVIVVAIGIVVLFQGINGIQAFNNSLNTFTGSQQNAPLEALILEHIRFDPTTNNVILYVRNTGATDFTIDAIKMVKVDTQELIINDVTVSTKVFPGNNVTITESGAAVSLTQGSQHWNDNYYKNSPYSVSITTVRGTFYQAQARPFNS